MQVSGSAEPGSEVTVNGVPVAVAPDGSFHALVNTGKGRTSITVTATDGAGNSATRTLHAVGVGEPAPAPKSPWSGTWSLAGQLLALASLVLLSALAMDVVRRRRATSRRE